MPMRPAWSLAVCTRFSRCHLDGSPPPSGAVTRPGLSTPDCNGHPRGLSQEHVLDEPDADE
jgi:hypothetical protein